MKTSKYDDFKDVFYHCIPIPNTLTKRELSSKIRLLAAELYDDESSRLQTMVNSNSLTKESWIRRAQRLVILPDYDHKEKTTYISIRKCGSCSGNHEELLDLFATKLMSNAPKNYPVQKTVVSSEDADHSKPSPWFIYQDGKLTETEGFNRLWK
jgi:hypothetical protein